MIPLAKSLVSPVAITILTWKLCYFARLWKVEMDGRKDERTLHVKIVIIIDCYWGSAAWIKI